MDRRSFLALLASTAIPVPARPQAEKADYSIEIAPVTIELGQKSSYKTIGYNGSAPGPILRVPEGKAITVDVFNNTENPELVHWHGFYIPSNVDESAEEGTPVIPPKGRTRLAFTATPAGTRWYHSHMAAGRNLNRSLYTGQFGFFKSSPNTRPAITTRKPSSLSRNGTPF
ncbi:MAG TPA: multicopper oxidase domain-containing protein [Terracidiphilus sp.]|nr:multicopper oxidase domain-containing protein [Terracidiphilus sp.]